MEKTDENLDRLASFIRDQQRPAVSEEFVEGVDGYYVGPWDSQQAELLKETAALVKESREDLKGGEDWRGE